MTAGSPTERSPVSSPIQRPTVPDDPPRGRDIVVIAASAGGLEAVRRLIRALPADLPAAVFVLLHLPAGSPSVRARLLARVTRLPVASALDGEEIHPARVYVTPPDHRHLARDATGVHLILGPKEHHVRPAADVLFRSAARAFGPRVVGIILSGTGSDGTAGLSEIKAGGGVTVVQDPGEAGFPAMPRRAIADDSVDYVLPVEAIAELVARLAREPIPDANGTDPPGPDQAADRSAPEPDPSPVVDDRGSGSLVLACPEGCSNGVLVASD